MRGISAQDSQRLIIHAGTCAEACDGRQADSCLLKLGSTRAEHTCRAHSSSKSESAGWMGRGSLRLTRFLVLYIRVQLVRTSDLPHHQPPLPCLSLSLCMHEACLLACCSRELELCCQDMAHSWRPAAEESAP